LSIAASLKAQQLAATAQGNVGILKESREYFVTSAKYVRAAYVHANLGRGRGISPL